jgi:small multidrug resistance pump
MKFEVTVTMAWIFLACAILFEVVGTTNMKMSQGFKNLAPSITMFVCYAIAFGFNTMAVRKLDLSVTYAIWSGVGTALTALIGFLYFKEPVSVLRVTGIFLIIAGVCALYMSVGE